jgi:hypothetical protein
MGYCPDRWDDLEASSSFLFVLSRDGGDRVGFDVESSEVGTKFVRGLKHQAQRRPHTQGRTGSRITRAESIFMGWGAPRGMTVRSVTFVVDRSTSLFGRGRSVRWGELLA